MSRKLKALDNLFLQLDTAATPMHVGGLLLFTGGDGRERHQRMRSEPVRSEPFNLILRPSRLPGGTPSWDVLPTVDVDAHLRLHGLSEGSPQQVMARVSEVHGRRMDRGRPMWGCDVFAGLAEGRYAYFYRVHHACIDGMSAIRRMQAGLSRSASEETPPLWAQPPRERRPRPATPPPTWRDAVTAMRGNLRVVDEVISALREAVGAHGSTEPRAAVPFVAPRIAMNRTITSGRRSVAWQRLPLTAVRAIGKAAGGTVNDVIMTVISGALRADLLARGGLPDESLVTMVPFSLREMSDAGDGSNSLSCLLVDLATDKADPTSRLRAIQASARDAKRMLRQMSTEAAAAYALVVNFPAIAATLLGVYDSMRIPFNTVISNVPGPREPLYDNGARLEAIYPISLLYDRQGINFTVISYQDEIDLGLVGTEDAMPDAVAMADGIRAELEVLSRAVLGHSLDG